MPPDKHVQQLPILADLIIRIIHFIILDKACNNITIMQSLFQHSSQLLN